MYFSVEKVIHRVKGILSKILTILFYILFQNNLTCNCNQRKVANPDKQMISRVEAIDAIILNEFDSSLVVYINMRLLFFNTNPRRRKIFAPRLIF